MDPENMTAVKLLKVNFIALGWQSTHDHWAEAAAEPREPRLRWPLARTNTLTRAHAPASAAPSAPTCTLTALRPVVSLLSLLSSTWFFRLLLLVLSLVLNCCLVVGFCRLGTGFFWKSLFSLALHGALTLVSLGTVVAFGPDMFEKSIPGGADQVTDTTGKFAHVLALQSLRLCLLFRDAFHALDSFTCSLSLNE